MLRAVAIGSCLSLLVAMPAWAGDISIYAGAYGGASLLTDNTVEIIDFEGGPVMQTFYLDYDSGLAAGVYGGVRITDMLRVGIEVAHRSGTLGELTSPGNIITPGYSFDTSATALLATGIIDLPTGGAFTPYVGVGVGGASFSAAGSIAPGDPSFDYDTEQTGLAFMLKAGVAVKMTDQLSLTADYSYLHVSGLDAVISDFGFADKIGEDFGSHALSVGLMFDF